VQLRRETACHADEGDRRLLVEPRREIASRTPGALGTGADDQIGAADCERLDAKGRQDLELSRRTLRSRSGPAP
jgi:hypothetical protein